jgi:hypothetical protein
MTTRPSFIHRSRGDGFSVRLGFADNTAEAIAALQAHLLTPEAPKPDTQTSQKQDK